MTYLYIGSKVGTKYYGWDSVGGVSTRGMKGHLAKAITYIPKSSKLFGEFLAWAKDLEAQGYLQNYKGTVLIQPYTSKVCAKCYQNTSKKKRTRDESKPYNDFTCTVCGGTIDLKNSVNKGTAEVLFYELASLAQLNEQVSAIDR